MSERRYPDLWLDPADDPRQQASIDDGSELGVLTDYLRVYRMTLELKCADLTAEQLARRAVPPSSMSLLGLIRHLADVERTWFRQRMAGEDAPRRFRRADDRDADWNDAAADDAMVDEAWRAWSEEVAYAQAYVERAPNLEVVGHWEDQSISLRELLVHMIEEYARHLGHADLLRECIDGRTGQ
ncbi:DinB family protein [Leekyejoonella antrihumi]|uniref:DinB family protein n=1 Tax=Leekyejoonella antrihumi TaxID=1660198 RepID=A0A563E0E4_9MICO|nr:DinB family protein [Leekyejoonella antrihumi]TWP36018.1 DinB family protein [Leekyejoonella antrihumi]